MDSLLHKRHGFAAENELRLLKFDQAHYGALARKDTSVSELPEHIQVDWVLSDAIDEIVVSPYAGEKYENLDLRFFHDRLKTARHDLELAEIRDLYGRTNRAEFPREAMGLGDVKLIAALGTFVGWQGVLFTIPIAAFLGCVFGAVAMLLRQKSLSVRVPFGPFLSAGAVLWILCGPELVGLYERIIGLTA